MRITPADYTAIEAGLTKTLEASGISKVVIYSTADMWQVFHFAWGRGHIDGSTLYKTYDDSHIETALRKYFK